MAESRLGDNHYYYLIVLYMIDAIIGDNGTFIIYILVY